MKANAVDDIIWTRHWIGISADMAVLDGHDWGWASYDEEF